MAEEGRDDSVQHRWTQFWMKIGSLHGKYWANGVWEGLLFVFGTGY
jgi:hypothetical protein